jgi:superfamily I DNA/RNA helicase
VFSIYQLYDADMNTAGLSDYDDFILNTLKFINPEEHNYRYVGAVVDEIQDLSESTIKLIRKMVISGPNDLFLVGDGTQRIYKGGFALSKVGVNISRQSGAILRYNYRNTRQIMHLAEWLMEDVSIDDLDDEETSTPPKPERAVREGEIPTLQICHSPQEEIQRIMEEIKHLKQSRNYDERDFAILYRTGTPYKELAREILEKQNGHEVVELDKSATSYFGPGIKLTTFHSAKGLEFKVVFIVGLSNERMPFFHDGVSGMSPKEIDHHTEAERRLLYVAVTRARDLLYLSYSPANEPSRFIANVPEEIIVALA